jgi:hypothetical protein
MVPLVFQINYFGCTTGSLASHSHRLEEFRASIIFKYKLKRRKFMHNIWWFKKCHKYNVSSLFIGAFLEYNPQLDPFFYFRYSFFLILYPIGVTVRLLHDVYSMLALALPKPD